MDWSPFTICSEGEFPPSPRGLNSEHGLGDRLRVAAFAELQAREAFLWAAAHLPDANPDQKSFWKKVAQEEDRHLQMLLLRMKQLGVRIGERPVSNKLWISLTSCQTTSQFLKYMKTAEERGKAAEESFSRLLADKDPITANIFAQIAADEEQHIMQSIGI